MHNFQNAVNVSSVRSEMHSSRATEAAGSSQLDQPGVLLQVRQLTERVLAVGAVVGFDAQVNAQVLGQVRGVGEGLGAVGTFVWFGLCVRLGMNLHL